MVKAKKFAMAPACEFRCDIPSEPNDCRLSRTRNQNVFYVH
jgi:hypothetical protein